ncbi:ubiquinol-cytochrome c reductase iron-sulfur subunit [Fodinicola acaciae]|uniref:QcrA and Rieske domain-containing protein n=1 Tax=Fodinicola acaciae TaxID=2681555 RepID=UPI001652B349|nr:Rieske (2Fe-2S) protein [Fodinicola acaciae]
MSDFEFSRRRMIAGTALAVGSSAVLTACGGGTTTPSSPPTTGGAPEPTGAANSSGGGSGGGQALAKLSDIPVGQAISTKTPDGRTVIVAQPTAGTAVAFSATCTHMGCTVAPVGKQLNCPCHGSQFDATTGKVLQGPAARPLSTVDVHVADGNVVAGKA